MLLDTSNCENKAREIGIAISDIYQIKNLILLQITDNQSYIHTINILEKYNYN